MTEAIEATRTATNPFKGMLGELGRCGTIPGSIIRNLSPRVPVPARRSLTRVAAAS